MSTVAAFTDHLWQSTCFAALVWGLAWLLRRNSALLRLSMWRIAALKFLLPFSVLLALGGWLGFPVRHSAIPPPAAVTETAEWLWRTGFPATAYAPVAVVMMIALLLALTVAGLCGLLIVRQLRAARWRQQEEIARVTADGSHEPAPLGFLVSATLAGAALGAVAAPIFVGAVQDRLRRQEALAIDIRALRSAEITLRVTSTIFGGRSTMLATEEGISISHINLQDLVAQVYGIGQFEVFGGALPWLTSPHYNVHVKGRVHAPEVFDPYSLRQSVTDYLYASYGVSIRVNGLCQEPCLNQQSFVIERVP